MCPVIDNSFRSVTVFHNFTVVSSPLEARTAEEARALHFCDEVFGDVHAAEPVAAFDYTRFKAPPPELLRKAGQGQWANAGAA